MIMLKLSTILLTEDDVSQPEVLVDAKSCDKCKLDYRNPFNFFYLFLLLEEELILALFDICLPVLKFGYDAAKTYEFTVGLLKIFDLEKIFWNDNIRFLNIVPMVNSCVVIDKLLHLAESMAIDNNFDAESIEDTFIMIVLP
jgi:hypothetical protein